jgi:membrane protein
MTKRAHKERAREIQEKVSQHHAHKQEGGAEAKPVHRHSEQKLTWENWKHVLKRSAEDVANNHILAFAGSLSYYFVLSLFPALIAMAAIVSLLPIPNLFQNVMDVIARAVPADSMAVVSKVVADVIRPHSGGLLSFGLLGSLWSASSGFSSIIESLNVAYDVPETRPWWKTRLLALGLTILVGGMLVVSILCMTLGPQFFQLFADKIGLGGAFIFTWKFVRWPIALALVVVSIEIIYFLAPNVRQCFRHTLTGAIVAVVSWLILTAGLGIYFAKFANFNATYGALGAAIGLLVWLYWTSFAVLIGGELNSEIIQERGDGKLPLKQQPPDKVRPVPSDAAQLAA